MRTVIYARVSTKGQAAEEKVSIPDQIEKAKKQIDLHNWVLAHEPFVDAGISGRKFEERKALQEMLDFIRSGKADLVVVYDSDRVGRRSSVSQHIYEIMDKHKVQLYSISQPVEPKTPDKYNPLDDDSGFILRSVTSMTSEMYVRQLARRSKAGKENRVRQGMLYARAPYGYEYIYNSDGSRKLVIIEERAATIRRIFNSYLDGKGTRAIAIELNRDGIHSAEGKQWSSSTVGAVLVNQHYYGKTYMGKSWANGDKRVSAPAKNWLIVQGKHPPIVTDEIWHRVAELRRRKFRYGKSFGPSHVLSGICKCGICGSSMTISRRATTIKNIRRAYLMCAKHTHSGGCERNSYLADDLIAEVLDFMADLATNPALSEKVQIHQSKSQSDDLQGTVLTLEKQLYAIAQRKEKSRYAYETGVDLLSEYQEFKKALDEQHTKIVAQLNGLHSDIELIQGRNVAKGHFVDLIKDIPGKFTAQTLAKQKVLLRSIIERIVITRKSFQILFRF